MVSRLDNEHFADQHVYTHPATGLLYRKMSGHSGQTVRCSCGCPNCGKILMPRGFRKGFYTWHPATKEIGSRSGMLSGFSIVEDKVIMASTK